MPFLERRCSNILPIAKTGIRFFERIKDWALNVAVPVTVKNYKNVRRTAVVYVYTYSSYQKGREKESLIFAFFDLKKKYNQNIEAKSI